MPTGQNFVTLYSHDDDNDDDDIREAHFAAFSASVGALLMAECVGVNGLDRYESALSTIIGLQINA